jgi:hypothetical protein
VNICFILPIAILLTACSPKPPEAALAYPNPKVLAASAGASLTNSTNYVVGVKVDSNGKASYSFVQLSANGVISTDGASSMTNTATGNASGNIPIVPMPMSVMPNAQAVINNITNQVGGSQAAYHPASDFDWAGAAATVQSNLTTGLSGKLSIPTGTTSQYIRGDASLATFPTNVSSFSNDAGYVTTSGLASSLTAYTTNTALTSALANYATTSSLSAYETTSALTSTLGSYATTSALTSGLAGKFATPSGTTAQYLNGQGTPVTFPTIPAAQVNSDWNASSGLAQILNKPTIPAAQVNSNWNSTSGVSQILNQPRFRRFFTLNTLLNVGTTGDKATVTIPSSQWNIQSFILFAPSANMGAATMVELYTGPNATGTKLASNLLGPLTTTSAPLVTAITSAVIQTGTVVYIHVSVANTSSQTLSAMIEILDYSSP